MYSVYIYIYMFSYVLILRRLRASLCFTVHRRPVKLALIVSGLLLGTLVAWCPTEVVSLITLTGSSQNQLHLSQGFGWFARVVSA